MRYCTVCGSEIPDSGQCCPVCGSVVPEVGGKSDGTGYVTPTTDGQRVVTIDPSVVSRAMQGDETAFHELYEKTYFSNLYTAKKYMKSDAAAEDVLQEAYIRIWTNLPSLRQPEGYVNWSRRIVANTALNELRKTQPLLFSEVNAENGEGSEMEFQVEDTYVPNQPELSFTEREEQEIIREMIDSLSDEQRMCIMMYYMEDLSVREIAETLGCSEGTVKSRLNYGRQNIKAKAEELQKKGYNFKGISALAVLLVFLGREAFRAGASKTLVATAVTAAAPAASAPATAVSLTPASTVPAAPAAGTVASSVPAAPTAGTAASSVPAAPSAGVGASTAGTAAKAAGGSFFKTMAGKVVLSVGGLLVAAGITVGVILFIKDKEKRPEQDSSMASTEATEVVTEETSAGVTEAESETKTEAVTETPTEAATEAETVDMAYVDEYTRILAENETGIKNYVANVKAINEREKKIPNNKVKTRSEEAVAIIDTLGDETPELFILTDAEQHADFLDTKMSVYTMQDGEAVPVLENATFDIYAGSGQQNEVYASKSKNGFYWHLDDPTDSGGKGIYTSKISFENGDMGREFIGYTYDGESKKSTYSKGTSNAESTVEIKKSEYKKIQKEWKKDYGDRIFDNMNGKKVIAQTYKKAESTLKKLGKGIEKDTEEKKEKATEAKEESQKSGAKKQGETVLKEMAKALHASAKANDMSKMSDFDSKYHTELQFSGWYVFDADQVEYGYYDLDQDGTEELILKGAVSGVVSFRTGKPVFICSTSNPREAYICLKDGHIKHSMAEMSSQSIAECEINKDATGLNELRSATYDANGGEKELQDLNNSLAPELELEWESLADLK